jgi:hypothetical protein
MQSSGVVKSVNKTAATDPFGSIKVATPDSGKISISPWQVLEIKSEAIAVAYEPTAACLGLRDIFASLAHDPMLSRIWDLSDVLQADCRAPVDLQFILARLNAGWYRSLPAVHIDVHSMLKLVDALQDPALKDVLVYAYEVLSRGLQEAAQLQ